jgi:hypothetical protein
MTTDETQAIVVVMVVGMTCGIPLLGLTLRFSLKPVVEAFIRLREAQLGTPQLQQLPSTSLATLAKDRERI